MSRPFTYQCLAIFLFLGISFQTLLAQGKKKSKNIHAIDLTVKIPAKDTCLLQELTLFGWRGTQVIELTKTGRKDTKNGTEFLFQLNDFPTGSYYVGTSMQDMRPLHLGTEANVVLVGSCKDFRSLKIENSPANQAFDEMIDSIRVQSNDFFEQITAYQQNVNNADALSVINKRLEYVDFRKKASLDKFNKLSPELGKTIALFTYQSYQNHNKIPNQREGIYLAESFFQYVDLSDTCYFYSAYFYEAVKGYATNLTRVGLYETEINKYLDSILVKVGEQNPHYRSALLGIAFGVMSANKALFKKYATLYIDRFKGENIVLDNFVEQQLVLMRDPAGVGEIATDFSAPTPDGKELSLKDLRGKVVLVDFWASWCGPCRRENPNVVAAYNKFKDKGFDILSVSLDNNRERWLGAIEQDGLVWHHISDLKGWGSVPAQLYKVTGIPFTMLVDRDGKIIAKNLRGAALEMKLKEVLGD